MRTGSPDPIPARRADASMSLLVDLWTDALDPGYAAAARAGHSGGSARRTATLSVGVLAAAFLVVVAALQAHIRAPAAARSRTALVDQVQRQSAAVNALSREVDQLRADTARLQDASLQGSSAGAAVAAQLRQAELAAGTIAVTGPGLTVSLDDAPATSTGDQNRVQDRDVQAVVNALWAAGAEAVAINGQRLSAQSSIRQAGQAILVNFQPLRAPYVVSAIGDPVGLETTFAQSNAASRMRSYVQLYGLRFDYTRERHLDLPPAVEEPMHEVTAIPEPSGRGSGP